MPPHRDHLPLHNSPCKVVNHMLLCRCARDRNDSIPRESESTACGKMVLILDAQMALGTSSVTGKHLFYV